MLRIPQAANYWRNYDKAGANDPCCVCGKGIKPEHKTIYLRTWNGADAVTEAEATTLRTTQPDGDSGCYPIGADCLRNHPELKPYALRLKKPTP